MGWRDVIAAAGALSIVWGSASPAGALPASSQADVLTPDLRCLIVGLTMANSTDPARRTAGVTFTTYYMGRLDAAGIGDRLEDRLFAEESAMTQTDVATEATRCGRQLQQRGQAMIAMGHRLMAREAARGGSAAQATAPSP
jgi:hypothetical protein